MCSQHTNIHTNTLAPWCRKKKQFAKCCSNKTDNRTQHWIHLHSVLRFHSNNTTNFIFIANKTNFYHYLASVCSLKANHIVLCLLHSCSLDSYHLAVCSFIRSFVRPSVYSSMRCRNKRFWFYWCAYFSTNSNRGYHTTIPEQPASRKSQIEWENENVCIAIFHKIILFGAIPSSSAGIRIVALWFLHRLCVTQFVHRNALLCD